MEAKYRELLEKLLLDIDSIDNETPWQEVEPEWWVQMMVLRRSAQERFNRLDT